jgi:hypothetical protein
MTHQAQERAAMELKATLSAEEPIEVKAVH